jgi:hypothetical protein
MESSPIMVRLFVKNISLKPLDIFINIYHTPHLMVYGRVHQANYEYKAELL